MSTTKSILITDSDLDGVSSIILSKVFNIHYDNVIITNPRSVNISDVVNAAKAHDKIIVTDLSFNESVIQMLQTLHKQVEVYDHHKTSDYLNNDKLYPKCISDITRCGGMIYFDEVIKHIPYVQINGATCKFIQLVDTYDRWQQHSTLWNEAYKLNAIFSYYQKVPYTFIDKYAEKLKHGVLKYDAEDENVFKEVMNKVEIAYKYAEQHLKIAPYEHGFKGITYHNGYVSEVGNRLIQEHNITYIIMIEHKYKNIASARSVEDFDCTGIPGFKGHKNAAGGKFDNGYLERVYNRFG